MDTPYYYVPIIAKRERGQPSNRWHLFNRMFHYFYNKRMLNIGFGFFCLSLYLYHLDFDTLYFFTGFKIQYKLNWNRKAGEPRFLKGIYFIHKSQSEERA